MFLYTIRDAIRRNDYENNKDGLPYGKLVQRILEILKVSAAANETPISLYMELFTEKSLKQMNYILDEETNTWVKKDEDREQRVEQGEGSSRGNSDLALVMNGITELRVRMDQQSQQNHYLYSYLEDMRDKLGLEPDPQPYPFPPPPPLNP